MQGLLGGSDMYANMQKQIYEREAVPVPNPTVRENLDRRINQIEVELARLKGIRDSMPETMLDLRIGDLRTAMDLCY